MECPHAGPGDGGKPVHGPPRLESPSLATAPNSNVQAQPKSAVQQPAGARALPRASQHGSRSSGAVVFGVGVNGHVALNEPGVNPSLRTHIADVSPVTESVAQKYFASAAPSLAKGVSIGLANASEARKIFVMANTANKRPAIERTVALLSAGQPSAEVPASIVAALPQAELCVTEAVFA